MGYKELNIKKSYETTENKNELLEEFYIPFLSETKCVTDTFRCGYGYIVLF